MPWIVINGSTTLGPFKTLKEAKYTSEALRENKGIFEGFNMIMKQ